jgi:hypothetical protein
MTKIKPRLYILPGWGHRATDINYRKLIGAASKKYRFVPLKIATRNRKYSMGSEKSIDAILEKISNQIIKPYSNDTILGFSIGALQAYLLARKLKFKQAVLCSLSPILGDDLLFYKKKDLTDLSPIQYREMKKLQYPRLATKKVVLFYGEKEHSVVKNRTKKLGRRKGYRVIEIKKTDHDFNSVYTKAVEKVLLA